MALQAFHSPSFAAEGTIVLYPSFATEGEGRVIAVLTDDTAFYAVTDRTPFHPLDAFWRDQPGDKGTLTVGNITLPVNDTVTCVRSRENGAWLLNREIAIKRTTPDWDHFVAHRLETDRADAGMLLDRGTTLQVDKNYRRPIAAAHTANHLTALALNAAAARFWTDATNTDSLGHPDLDAAAIAESTIDSEGSSDRYRFGKSLRKMGFAAAAFLDALDTVAEEMNARVAGWLSARMPVTLTPQESLLSARRQWHCELGGTAATIGCGGVHIDNLGQIAAAQVSLSRSEAGDGILIRTQSYAHMV